MFQATLSNETAPVIAGLGVGIGLILLFVALDLDFADVPASNIEKVEYKTKYNSTNIPDLHMIVKSTGKIYAGEEGSYCWDGICADFVKIIPENTIILRSGEEMEFRLVNYKIPEEFGTFITSEDPALQPRCIEYESGQISCGLPEGVELTELTKLDNDFKYMVDVPVGTYTIGAYGNWLADDANIQNQATYYYRVQVK